MPTLAITMGDVNGVGPEILVKALARPEVREAGRLLVLGSGAVFDRARTFSAGCPDLVVVSGPEELSGQPGSIGLLDAGLHPQAVQPGVVVPDAGRCAVEWFKAAVRMAMAGSVDGVVTCPIHKECIHKAGYDCAGHTDLMAEMTGAGDYCMSLFAGEMRIVHVTAHLALRDALDALTAARIVRTIHVAHEALFRMGLGRGRIAVAGVNPHAGEAGAFGREEIDEIIPAVETCREEGIDCTGPYPPDTVFRRMRAGEFDLVVAMYHDQGHIPLKLVAMDEGVNVTLGVPVVRTSVDHGTAFDIAWKGVACEDSLCAAIRLAAQLAGKGTCV